MSGVGLRLVPLKCCRCEGALTASPGAVVVLCGECGAGFEVMPDGELRPVPVSFARYARSSDAFYPFWVFDARIRLGARESDRPASAAGGLAARFRALGSLRLYCAAFMGELEKGWPWSLKLSIEQPELQEAARQKTLDGLALSEADARLLAADIFVTGELRLPDAVRALEFDLELRRPRVVSIAL